MTVKQLIEVLQTMPEDLTIQCKDAYNDRYYRPRDAIMSGFDDCGEECDPSQSGCTKYVTLQITEV